MTLTLRPRQTQAVEDLRQAYASGARAPILVAPTGFGKTHVSAEIVRLTITNGRSVWFLAHLREILDDTADRLTAAGIPFGQIRAGRSSDYTKLVHLVGVATAVRRAQLPRPDLIIIDECHLAVAESYRKVIAAAGHPLLLGLTGTPQRLDGRGLCEVFDRLVLTCSTAELIDEGLLAPVRVFAPPPPDLSKLHTRGGDYDQGEASAVLSKPAVVGDALSHWRKLCAGRRGVAFCTTVAHAQAVAEQWRRDGYRAVAVHGGSDDAERREAITGLRAGRLDLVACAQLWIAGVDVPEIDAVVWLRPTQSLTAWLQGNGRGLRIAPGKRDLLVLDHVGNCTRLDHPLFIHPWTLEGRIRKQTGEAAPSVKVCPQCFSAMASAKQTCPDCGHQFTPERRELQHVDGELVEILGWNKKKIRIKPGDEIYIIDKHGNKAGPRTVKRLTKCYVICYTEKKDEVFEYHYPNKEVWAPPFRKGDAIVRKNHKTGEWDGGWRIAKYDIKAESALVIESDKYKESEDYKLQFNGETRLLSKGNFKLDEGFPPDPRREQAKAQTLEQLIEIGKRREMKNPHGWARHVMRARQAKRGRVVA